MQRISTLRHSNTTISIQEESNTLSFRLDQQPTVCPRRYDEASSLSKTGVDGKVLFLDSAVLAEIV